MVPIGPLATGVAAIAAEGGIDCATTTGATWLFERTAMPAEEALSMMLSFVRSDPREPVETTDTDVMQIQRATCVPAFADTADYASSTS